MHDLTTGSIRAHLLKLTGFMLFSMFLQTLYMLVDLYWVGRLGKDAVAAVSISGNLMMVVMALMQVLAVGTAALVSHAAGRKDRADVLLFFNQSQVLALAGAAVFVVAGFAGRGAYLHALAADAETARLGNEYLLWFVPAMALQFALVGMGAALRGTGNMRPGVIAQAGTVVLNMVLAPFLIFGWLTGHPLGVAGAGLATFLSIAAGTAGLVLYFRRKATYLQWDVSLWRPRPGVWGRILKIGLPSGAEFALMAAYMFLIFAIIREFGSAAQAGFGIGMRILQAGFLPAMAVSFAVAAVAGQNFGAQQAERVRESFRVGALYACALMVLLMLLFHVAPQALVGGFSRDAEVLTAGGEFLRIISWNLVASGLIMACSGMFQAMGNTVPSLIASAIRILLMVALAIWLSHRPGFQLWQLWWVSVATVFVQMGLCLALLGREFSRRLVTMPTVPVQAPAP